MLKFHPLGFVQQALALNQGVMAYYTPDDQFWDNRCEIAVVKDRPPLVFLHSLGGGSSAFEWSKVYPAFATTHRVLAPDLIGWGQSTHVARNYSVEDYFEMITQFLETVAAPPVRVIATSLTAGVVIRLAILRPELFEGLFLVSPSGNSDFGRDYKASLPALLASTPGLDRLIYQLGAANELAVQSFLANFLFADPNRLTTDIIQAYLAGTQQPNAEYSALSSLTGEVSFDLSRFVDQLRVPTEFVVGQKSRFLSPEVVKRLASLNPKTITKVWEIPDSGVLPHLEHPAIVTGLLKKWIGEYPV
jgi:pimeloyl-ACP methyl ester carboxylesterase